MLSRELTSVTPFVYRSGRASTFVLWISLVGPSLYVVHKYLGWRGALAYGIIAGVGIAVASGFARPRSTQVAVGLAVVAFALMAVAFGTIYPIANVHVPGAGSDDDDAYNVGAAALLTGHSPYAERTYLGNALHQLPGAFLLAIPFVVLGTSALQNLFWIPMFFAAVKTDGNDTRAAVRLAWLALAFSPVVMHQVVTGTAHVSNTIYVLLGVWWLSRTPHRDLASVAWGVALASRANFLLLVPLQAGWLRQHHGWRVALRATALTCGTVALLTLPFYLHDPRNFGPLEAVDRLVRFNAIVPFAGETIAAVMAAIAIGLSFTRMDKTRLFRNCALVQAFPVVVGTVLGTVQRGELDLAYATYGTFAAWFALMSVVQPPSSPRTPRKN